MGVREISASYEFVCDGCGLVEKRPSNSRPAYWTGLHIEAHAYDYQGCAVADASVKRLLCQDCTSEAHKAINNVIAARREARTLADATPNPTPRMKP